MEKFIYSNELSLLKFYGINISIHVIIIDEKPSEWVVAKRTCNKQDEETWIFNELNTAIIKYKDIISKIKTPWGSDIANML